METAGYIIPAAVFLVVLFDGRDIIQNAQKGS
jgi:hypothetical protein